MGILSIVKRRKPSIDAALAGTPAERSKDARQWIESTVRRGEAVYRQRGYNAQDMADIARVMAWVWWAGKFNASNTCSVPIRLYRPGAGPGSKTYPGVRVSRARQKWLRGEGQHRPNHKAMVYGANSDDIEEVLEHPALELLAYGNRWIGGGEIRERLHLSLEWTGNAYWHVDIGASSNRPAEVFALLPQHTRIQPSDTDFIDGYWYGREGHIETWFEGDRFRGANRTMGEVDHWKANPSPVDPYYGRSWVDFLHREIDIYDAARENELARWDNNARPDYAIMLTGEGVNQDSADRLKAKIMAEHRGPRSAGRIMVLAGEQATLAPLNFSAKEMEYLAGLTNVRDTILSVADIPSTMVDKAGVVANSAEGRRQYMETAILPRLVKFVDVLNDRLLPRFGVEEGEMWFAFDNPVPQDEALTIQRVQSYVPIGVLTINEARAMEGLDPSDDEMADAHLYNGQPVGQAPPDPFGGLGGFGQDDEGRTDAQPAEDEEKSYTLRDLRSVARLCKEFREEDHPRDEDGQFTSGGGGGGGSSDSSGGGENQSAGQAFRPSDFDVQYDEDAMGWTVDGQFFDAFDIADGAKSIEEARRHSAALGVTTVGFDDSSRHILNRINEAVLDIPKKERDVLSKGGALVFQGNKETNAQVWSDEEKFGNIDAPGKFLVFGKGDERNGVYINPKYSSRRMTEEAERGEAIGFYSSGRPGRMIVHEIGHAAHYANRPDSFSGVDTARFGTGERKIAESVSGYAKTNPMEFVAEVFAGLVAKKKYGDDVMHVYKRLGGYVVSGGGS